MRTLLLHRYFLWFLFALTSVVTFFECLWFFQDVVFNPDFESTVKIFASKISPAKIYALFWGAFIMFMVKWIGALLMALRKYWGYFLYLVPNVLALLLALYILVVWNIFNWQPFVFLIGTIMFMVSYTYLYFFFKRKSHNDQIN
ncbi:MAG: hypothetical protein N2Z72_02605 [Bacteroidales bacterium]|nr:hypothetical protein [Bacteroidales bacterium]